jgi:hypothetical protein
MIFNDDISKLESNSFRTLIVVLSLISFSCSSNNCIAQTKSDDKNFDIKPFNASILNSFYAEAYSVQIVLTEKSLKIIFKSDLVGEKDTTVYSKTLQPSDTLEQIGEINLNQLKNYYDNPCIEDGSQVTVVIKKDNKTKAVHVSNYYQEDIGKIIYLVNSLVPSKYRIWYDKERLIADYNRCKGNK